MVKDVSIHTTYESRSQIIICPRSEYISKISEEFNIETENIELYDAKTDTRITPVDLSDVMRVKVKKNGNNIPVPSQENPMNSTIMDKLYNNRALTGAEREYISKLLPDPNFSHLKRKLINESSNEIRNVKFQVYPEKLIPRISTRTQTDRSDSEDNVMEDKDVDTEYEQQSKRLANNIDKINKKKATAVMDKLYDERRQFILMELPLVSFVKEKYPLLFCLSEAKQEIDRLFYQGKCEEFLNNVAKYSKPIMRSAKDDDDLLALTERKVYSFSKEAEKKYALQVGSILVLSSLMLEDICYLKLEDQTLKQDRDMPYIESPVKFDEIFRKKYDFKIFVEQNLLCKTTDFKEAILCLVGSYYIFNIKYPGHNRNTFSAFEQLYLEKIDTDADADADENCQEIIRCLQLKVRASEAKSSKM